MMIMRKSILFVIVFLISLAVAAQTSKGKVSVVIKNAQQTALDGATVELLRAGDSMLVIAAVTDASGLAEFVPAEGKYLIKAGMVGYAAGYSNVFVVSADNLTVSLPLLVLEQKTATQLQGVTVTARKPFIQKLSDRIVVNVDNSVVNAGSSAMDVLERSPGV